MHFDLLVIGAGPAGAAAARRAALNGLSVALVDRSHFPRDKICGDALIPDALRALAALQVSDRVLPLSYRAPALRVYAPNGVCVALDGNSACVPRQILDHALQTAAVDAGATFFAPLRVVAALMNRHAVVGATFRDLARATDVDIRARLTILATGASAEPLKRFGVCRRATPSATAARVYVHVDPRVASDFRDLLISYDASICPGYGWIFPGPNATFNIGVGYFYDARRLPAPSNLRLLLERFLSTFAPAVDLMRHATSVSPLRGAPLRTAMTGSEFARPGLLMVGEAAGLTYSFSGEGIGKAMESGMLAADIASGMSLGSDAAIDAIGAEYANHLTQKFSGKFDAYRQAQGFLTSPHIANFLVWRANSGRFVKDQLEAMFADTRDPRSLFSPLGLAQAILR